MRVLLDEAIVVADRLRKSDPSLGDDPKKNAERERLVAEKLKKLTTL